MAVICCGRDQNNGCLDWFRQNIKGTSVPYKVFLGSGCQAKASDEIVLPVADSYQRLPWKVQGAFQWALDREDLLSHICKVDCDARIWTDRLSRFDFSPYDYVGNFADGHEPALRPDTYAAGPGYVVSRVAAEMVIAADVKKTVETYTYPPFENCYLEDEFVGKVLKQTRRCHSLQFQSHYAGRAYPGPTHDLIVLGNEWSTDRGRR
jgi:hypothetical protein